ncbi:MAG: helix-turn-helix transcriptional regulator [Crocinitomicaceae bacterium]
MLRCFLSFKNHTIGLKLKRNTDQKVKKEFKIILLTLFLIKRNKLIVNEFTYPLHDCIDCSKTIIKLNRKELEMDRLTRLTSILIQLQSKKMIIAKEVAERFEISLRTVYRDLKTLQDAGIPIGSENGKGYFLTEGFHLPPIMLTEKEANTLVIAEVLIKNQGDHSLQNDFTSLLFKIKSVLRDFQKENYEKLEKRIAPSYIKTPAKSDSLSYFKSAIIDNRTTQITYHSIHKNEKSTRSINPLAVYFSNTAWILVAYCHSKKDFREFRLDRIYDYKLMDKTFDEVNDFNFTKYFTEKNQPKLT